MPANGRWDLIRHLKVKQPQNTTLRSDDDGSSEIFEVLLKYSCSIFEVLLKYSCSKHGNVKCMRFHMLKVVSMKLANFWGMKRPY